MTTSGFSGAGNFGGTGARLSGGGGHHVVLRNSRGPQTLNDLVAELGPLASAGTTEQAAQAGDIVVVSIPLKAYPSVPAAPLAGKTVIDTNNYYPERDGRFERLDRNDVTTSGLLQEHLEGAHVVKAFNNIFFRHLASLARPQHAQDRTALPISGDDEKAKAQVTEFLNSIGYDAVDAGPLAESWRHEPGTPCYGPPYGEFSDESGTPASADTIRAALAAASK